jgi:hypothetical protein
VAGHPEGLRRLDPAAVHRRQGGRKPRDASYFLRGIAFCRQCGGALYTREQAIGRVYVCKNRREGTGLCEAPPIRASVIEGHVLEHLDKFVGSAEAWVQEQVNHRSAEQQAREAAIDRDRAALADLDRQRERHFAEYRAMVANGDHLARYALEEVDRIDSERADRQQAIAEAEAVVSEWAGPPDVDAALDFYTGLVDLVQGRVQQARGTEELNQALSQVIAGLWADLDGATLHAEFELRAPENGPSGLLQAMAPDLKGRRLTLPKALYPGNPAQTDLVRASLETGTHTFV